jgi:hypothetical protein
VDSANLGAVDANVRMPLDIAFEQEHADPRDFVIALVELGAPLVANNISLYAVASASTTCIQALLDRGIAVGELRSTHLETPLFVNWHSDVTTTNHDQVALLNMLVNVCGVDIHARDSFGKTSCHRAIWDGNFPKLQWLIEAGADIDAADIEGKTQLHMLKRNPDFGWLLLLVAAGANVYARDNNGDTACHLVASLYEHDAKLWVNTLLASATNDLLDVPNQLGVTPRQLLAQRNLVVGNVAEVELARRRIARRRLRFVSRRALQVCIGLEPLHLDALQTCEILVHACGCLATLVPFHQWWKIATAVKHFNK